MRRLLHLKVYLDEMYDPGVGWPRANNGVGVDVVHKPLRRCAADSKRVHGTRSAGLQRIRSRAGADCRI